MFVGEQELVVPCCVYTDECSSCSFNFVVTFYGRRFQARTKWEASVLRKSLI